MRGLVALVAIACALLSGCVLRDISAVGRIIRVTEKSDELGRQCRYAEALAYLDGVPSSLDLHPNVLIERSILLGHLERFEEAERALDRIDEAYVTEDFRAEMMVSHGLNRSGLKQKEGALKALARARALGGDEALIANAEGITYAEASDYVRAEQLFEAALKLNPKLASALINLAEMKAQRGLLDEAVELLRSSWRAGQRNPDEIRRDPLLKPLVESGRIDDLLSSPVRECVL